MACHIMTNIINSTAVCHNMTINRDAIEARMRLMDVLTKGIRHVTLQNLVLLTDYLIIKRCETLNIRRFSDYFSNAHSSSIERHVVAQYLGCSDRTARDYLLTLRRIFYYV